MTGAGAAVVGAAVVGAAVVGAAVVGAAVAGPAAHLGEGDELPAPVLLASLQLVHGGRSPPRRLGGLPLQHGVSTTQPTNIEITNK